MNTLKLDVSARRRVSVVIVGSGIAGTWLGLKLVRAGVDTLIVHYSGSDRGGTMGSSIRSVGAINTSPLDRSDFHEFMEQLGQGQHHPSVIDMLTRYLPEEIEEIRSLGEFKRIKLGIALQSESAGPFLEKLHARFKSLGGQMLDAWVTRIVADQRECRGLQYQSGSLIGGIEAGAIVLACGGYAGIFDGSVKTNNYGTLLGRFLEAGGLATNLEFVFKHGYGKPDLGALTPTEELPGAQVYDEQGTHVHWLERELYEGRGTANHLEAFRHWRRHRDHHFFIDMGYRPLYDRVMELNVAIESANQQALELSVQGLADMSRAEARLRMIEKLRQWVAQSTKVDFEKFLELKPLIAVPDKTKVFRVRQIAYFSMGGIAHLSCATNLANVYVTGEAMHDFGAHRVGGLPWGLYLAAGRVIGDNLIQRWREGQLSPRGGFEVLEKHCSFDASMLQSIRAGLYQYQEHNFCVSDARRFVAWLRQSRRDVRRRTETLSDAVAWLIVAEAIMQSSLRRVESRGCFYRGDHPVVSEHLTDFFSCAYYDADADVVDANLVRSAELKSLITSEQPMLNERNELHAVVG
jgi:succinate dehydrogenase/fumarate reductase flavoprotein subunit